MPPENFPPQNRSETDTQFAARWISDAHECMIRRRILGVHRQRSVIDKNLRTKKTKIKKPSSEGFFLIVFVIFARQFCREFFFGGNFVGVYDVRAF